MQGFDCNGRRVTLKGASGIWFPQGFSMPISITTSLNGPYRLDDIEDDGLLTYAYRGNDPNHRDNRGLREACRTRTPLIYFKEVHEHRYQAIWPVIVLEDHPESLFVRAAMDPAYADLRPEVDLQPLPCHPLTCGDTPGHRPGCVCTRVPSGISSSPHMDAVARSVGWGTQRCSTLLTSSPIRTFAAHRSSRTGFPSARSTMPHTTATSLESAPTIPYTSAGRCSKNTTAPCSGMAFRSWTGAASFSPLG